MSSAGSGSPGAAGLGRSWILIVRLKIGGVAPATGCSLLQQSPGRGTEYSCPDVTSIVFDAGDGADYVSGDNLAFPIKFADQGPCSPDGDAQCKATTPDGKFTGDLRDPPYATAVKPLYLTTFALEANVEPSRVVQAVLGLASSASTECTG